jgi:glycosyltransferase involved in cell wall biosynthesis
MQTTPVLNDKKKVVYILSHPIQYFSPLLKEMSGVLDVEVYYYSDISIKGGVDKGFGKKVIWDTPLLEGYKSTFLRNRRAGRGLNNKFLDVWNPGVWNLVRNTKAKVIIVNDWTYSSTWLLFFIARLTGKKVWVRADNPVSQEYKKSKKIIALKKLVLQNFLFRFLIDKCLYCGKQSKAYFKFYGVPERSLVATPHAVHNDYFQATSVHDKSELNKIKAKYAIPPEKKVILFVGKYISEKRPLDLLEAFAKLSSTEYSLVMVGEGPMRLEIERRIAELKLQNVYLTGFINQLEIPLYYSIADVFVLSSGSETWGLAVNEAMNFAKPVIVSDACGCNEDLVVQGENGFVYETGNTEQLAGYLKKILEDDTFRAKAGQKSLEIIKSYSIGNIIRNIQTALNS